MKEKETEKKTELPIRTWKMENITIICNGC